MTKSYDVAIIGSGSAGLTALREVRKLTVRELLRMPFYHPVLEEGLRTALRDAAGKLGGKDLADLAHCGRMGVEAID